VKQLKNRSTDFHQIWYCEVPIIFLDTFWFGLKLNRNNGHSTWRPTRVFVRIWLNIRRSHESKRAL
jgi:hypothetical protein